MKIRTKNFEFGQSCPTYFIADIAANHDGDLERAKDLIYLCAESGANAAKFQNFTADKIVSKVGFEELKGPKSHQDKWKKSVFEIYQDASISKDWTPVLKETCDRAGIDYFTSPYDFASVDHVDPFLDVYKIGSGDISWIEMLEYIGKKAKPILLATGASDIEDVDRAYKALLKFKIPLVLMQCNTNYTGSLENFKYINLNVLKTYATMYPEAILGLSDHTPGHTTVLGSVCFGAKVIEKHFTDSNDREGPDHPFSMNPVSWKEMVYATRELEASLGDGVKRVEKNEIDSSKVQRRSLRAKKNLSKDHQLSADDFESLRPIPEDGFPPYKMDSLIGRTLSKPIDQGKHFTMEHLK